MYIAKYAVNLFNMPFDKYCDDEGFVHATGRVVKLVNEDYKDKDFLREIWVTEYENNAYDVPTLYYEDESGDYIPYTEEVWDELERIDEKTEWIFQNDFDINFEEGDIVKCAREG